MLRASRELKCKDLVVLTEDADHEEEVSWFDMKGKIRFVPLHRGLSRL